MEKSDDKRLFVRWPHLYYRKQAWYQSPDARLLALALLEHAAWSAGEFRDVEVKPGQVFTSRRQLMRWTGLPERRVRTAMRILEEKGFMEASQQTSQQTSQPGTLVTIREWETCNRPRPEGVPASVPANVPQYKSIYTRENSAKRKTRRARKPSYIEKLGRNQPENLLPRSVEM